jgi:hypothetical protein
METGAPGLLFKTGMENDSSGVPSMLVGSTSEPPPALVEKPAVMAVSTGSLNDDTSGVSSSKATSS